MNWGSLRSSLSRSHDLGPIGIEFGERAASFVQFSQPPTPDAKPQLLCATTAAYPEEREALLASPTRLRAFVRSALADRPFRGDRAVAAPRSSELRVRVLSYRVAEGQSEATVILERVREQLGLDLDNVIVDFLPIRTESGTRGDAPAAGSNRSALVVVAQRADVVAHLDRLAGAGLELEALEIAPLAIRRLLRWFDHDGIADSTVVVQCGATESNLIVYWGRRLILYRSVEFARDEVTSRLAKSLEMTGDEAATLLAEFGFAVPSHGSEGNEERARIAASITRIAELPVSKLVEQIELAAEYTVSRTRGAKVSQIRLVGDSIQWRGLTDLLAERTGMPVAWLDPAASFEAHDAASAMPQLEPSATLTLAMGYALRGVGSDE